MPLYEMERKRTGTINDEAGSKMGTPDHTIHGDQSILAEESLNPEDN